jgi:hypothetical protein
VAILVPVLALNAIPGQTPENFQLFIRNAGRSAEDDSELVITPVVSRVTKERIVVFASLLVRSVVNIRGVPYLAMRLVLRVLKPVRGLASTRVFALCLVRHLAINCHAISVVRRNFLAVISVQDFAERHVPKITATNVP